MDNNNFKESDQFFFNLLRDEVESKDLFEDKTHEQVAESIAKLIKFEKEGGVTIGLEGSWGSGKSFVISLLKEKLKTNNSIKFIQFDAWAHQGDPLRRIFLESLIDEINKDNNIELTKLKDKISKRIKTASIKTRRTVSCLGIWLSISAFLVPIGLALLSYINSTKYQSNGNGNLILGAMILICSPILVIIINLFQLFVRRTFKKIQKIFLLKYWSFLSDISDQKIEQEISEEEEKSSIEFEDYFQKIIKLFFNNLSNEARLVIVIDNLDRVNSEDALKIWSTLQTFLQQRSSINKDNWFKKIWILVPYDPEGLASLWKADEKVEQTFNSESVNTQRSNQPKTNTIPSAIAKAFFDKNFQLRYEISKPILTGWVDFVEKMANKAFINWDEKKKENVVDILVLTRKDLNDIPTPREIKNYINQVGLFASQFVQEISVKSIAYYVILRQMNCLSKSEIRKRLIFGELPDKQHSSFLPVSIKMDIAGLVFGVSPEKGSRLLLEPEIQNALQNVQIETLKNLEEKHKKDFWVVLNYHLQHCMPKFSDILNYSKTLHQIYGTEFNEADTFIGKVKNVVENQAISLTYSSESETEAFCYVIELCKNQEQEFLQQLHCLTLKNFETFVKSNEIPEYSVKFINVICEALQKSGITIKSQIIDFTSLDKFKQWCLFTFKQNSNSWNWVIPSENLIDEILIQAGVKIPNGTLEVIKYIINSNSKVAVNWDKLLTECQNHIYHSQGSFNAPFHSDEVFEIITSIGLSVEGTRDRIKAIITSGQYHNLFNSRYSQNILFGSIICGFVLTNELHRINIPAVGNSASGFQMIKTFWITSDNDNARKVLEYLGSYNQLNFLWQLAEDSQNKLVGNIITLITEDESYFSFFNVSDSLSKIKLYKDLVRNDDKDRIEKLTGLIIKYGKVESELLESDDLDLVENAEELFYVINKTENSGLINHISDKLKELSKEVWLDSLKNDSYLTSLVLETKKKKKEFELSLNFSDALVEFCNSGGIEKITDWQKNNWKDMIFLLSNHFQKDFSNKITRHFIQKNGQVSNKYLELSKDYFNKKEILKEEKFLEEFIDSFLENKDYEKIKFMTKIFSKEDVKKHHTNDGDKIKVIKERILENLKDADEEKQKLLEEVKILFDIEM